MPSLLLQQEKKRREKKKEKGLRWQPCEPANNHADWVTPWCDSFQPRLLEIAFVNNTVWQPINLEGRRCEITSCSNHRQIVWFIMRKMCCWRSVRQRYADVCYLSFIASICSSCFMELLFYQAEDSLIQPNADTLTAPRVLTINKLFLLPSTWLHLNPSAWWESCGASKMSWRQKCLIRISTMSRSSYVKKLSTGHKEFIIIIFVKGNQWHRRSEYHIDKTNKRMLFFLSFFRD